MKRFGKAHRRSRTGAVAAADMIRRRRPHPASPEALPFSVRATISFLGVLVVCCAAIAICTIIAEPRREPSASLAQPGPITGVAALHPGLLREARWPFATTTDGPPRPGHTTSPRPQANRPVPLAPEANPGAGSMESAGQVVADLYARLAVDPASALNLLCPELSAEDAELVRAWEEVEAARALRVEPQRDDAVVSAVAATYPDGARVVLRHRITVDWHRSPCVGSIEMLTAGMHGG
ncbi:hypothetical protein [Parasphingorhabdus pacifica]